MSKKIFDFFFSLLGIIIFLPLFIIITLMIKIESKGKVFYKQIRVGKNGRDFYLYKFRSMKFDSEKDGFLTIGDRDNRITRIGYFIRKYKIDELPQLINVFFGNMSLVGPRPEVPKYVSLYNEEQKKVLTIKPGITDYASIEFSNENELLEKVENPEQLYINQIMPAKLKLNLKYMKEQSIITDIKIILKTILKILN